MFIISFLSRVHYRIHAFLITAPIWSRYEQAAIDIVRFGVTELMINLQDIISWTDGNELATFLQQYYLT